MLHLLKQAYWPSWIAYFILGFALGFIPTILSFFFEEPLPPAVPAWQLQSVPDWLKVVGTALLSGSIASLIQGRFLNYHWSMPSNEASYHSKASLSLSIILLILGATLLMIGRAL